MANRNNIISIPLQDELCLNKNKIDITPFKGYTSKNGQLYGDVLSPLFKKEIENHDYFDKSGNYYDVTADTLKKNGESLFSFSENGIKHTKLEKKHDAIAYSSNTYIYADEGATSGNIIYKVSSYATERNITIPNCSIIRKIKCFINDTYNIGGFAVWFINSSGDETLYIRNSNLNATENHYTSTFLPEDVINNPFIQVYIKSSSEIIFSLYNNKGADLDKVSSTNFVLKGTTLYKNVTFETSGLSEDVINVSTKNINVSVQFIQNITSVTSGMGANLSGSQSVTVTLSSAWIKDVVVKYYRPTTMTTVTLGTIAAGQTTLTNTFATLSGTSSNASWSGHPEWAYSKENTIILETRSALENPTEEQRTAQTFQDVSFTLTSTNISYYLINNGSKTNYNKNYKENKALYLLSYEALELDVAHDVNGVMDNGLLINTVFTTAEENELEQKTNVITGSVSQITTSGTTATIEYVILKKLDFIDAVNYPRYLKTVVFNLSEYYYRVCLSCYTDKELTDSKFIMYDSASNKIYLNAGSNTGIENNNSGTASNVSSAFRLLFNNNYVSALSCYNNEDDIGTLLTDWLSFADDSDISVSENRISFTDNNNVTNLYEVTANKDWNFKVIENNYIVINTVSYINCYDIENEKPCHYATDYNNRCILGTVINNITYGDESIVIFEQKSQDAVLFASGINANYEITKNYLPSIQFGAVLFSNVITDQETVICGNSEGQTGESIDLYLSLGSESTVAYYKNSVKNNIRYKKPDLLDAYYPVASNGNILYSPNLFTRYIETFNNRDMLVNANTSYTLLYTNGHPVLVYQMLSGVDNMESVFVLQTSYYGVNKNKIFDLVYADGVISSATAIANIEGMQYLGALPNMALFWSASNKTIYSFTGDAILSEIKQANEINEIKKTAYNPATQEIFIFADSNIIVMSSNDIYKLEQFTNPKDVFFVDDNFVIVDAENTLMLSYNRKNDFVTNKIKVVTKYYGIGNDTPVNYDCWYVRLTCEGVKENGSVKVLISTITDVGFESEEKEIFINASDWDELTNSYYLRFQPEFQKGVGASLSLETEFPIVSIGCSYTTFDGAAQNSKYNV